MKKLLQILTFLIFGLNLSAQDVKINPVIKVDSTELIITQNDYSYFAYSSLDNKKTDSLIVTISTIGTSTTSIKIDLTQEPKAFISLYSDYNEYNGKHILDVEFQSYELELNSTEFKNGELIMGRIKGISKPIAKSQGEYQIEFEGEFSHIIGKLMIKNNSEVEYIILDDY